MIERSVVIISGSADRRDAIVRALRTLPLTIASQIGDPGALRLIPALVPDVAILDAATPALNPIAVLRAQMPAPVIVLAATASPLEQRLFLDLGALAVARLELPSTLADALGRIGQLSALARRMPARRGPLPPHDWPTQATSPTRA